jgi:hypothetical protein
MDTQYKDWRHAGHEIEQLGRRLDAVRECLARAQKDKSEWAINHWSQQRANLTARWRLTIMLKDTGMKQTNVRPRQVVRYDWYEDSEEPVFQSWFDCWPFNIFAQAQDARRIQAGLEASWEKRRGEIIQRARQGLI